MARPLSRAKLVRGMQVSHGNAAIARAAAALAREGDDRAKKIAAFNAAKGKDWGAAAEILNGFNEEDIQRLLTPLDKNQLRQLDAGAMRQIPGFAGRVHGPIMAKLGKAPGLPERRAAWAARHGVVTRGAARLRDLPRPPHRPDPERGLVVRDGRGG